MTQVLLHILHILATVMQQKFQRVKYVEIILIMPFYKPFDLFINWLRP